MKRVVVSGLGSVSPAGINIQETWENVYSKKNCFSSCDVAGVKFCGKVDEKFSSSLSKKDLHYMDRVSQFAVVAAQEALKKSEVDFEELKNNRVGIFVGSAMGGISTLFENVIKGSEDLNSISLLVMPMSLSNMIGTNISIKYGITGPVFTYNSACASSSAAIGEAFRKIQHGECDVAVAGGSEACVIPHVFASFSKLKAISTCDDIDSVCVPFSKNRSGFLLSEGASFLVLEEYEHAKKRNAPVYCEVLGYASNSDAKSLVVPSSTGIRECMRQALEDASLAPEKIEYINAHGTGTVANDNAEAEAIKSIFEESPFVSSTKSIHGHMLGASGAIESVLCSLMIKNKKLLAQKNVLKQDIEDEFSELKFLLDGPVEYKGGAVMNNSFGFGGDNVVLIFGQC